MQFEHIVRDGYSLAAAFALIVLGAGANVGVGNWIRRDYGWRPLMMFGGMLLVSTLFVAGLADRSMSLGSKVMKDHTHAFDSFTRLPTGSSYGPGYVLDEVRREMMTSQQWALGAFTAMTLAGLVLRWRRGQAEQWIRQRLAVLDRDAAGHGLNRALSPKTVVLIGVALSLGFGTVLAYVYYPPAPILLRDIAAVRTELYQEVTHEDRHACHRRMQQLDALLGKFPVSQFLRHGGLTEIQEALLEDWVERVDVLREFLIRGDFPGAKTVLRYVEQGHLQFRKSLQDDQAPARARPSPLESWMDVPPGRYENEGGGRLVSGSTCPLKTRAGHRRVLRRPLGSRHSILRRVHKTV